MASRTRPRSPSDHVDRHAGARASAFLLGIGFAGFYSKDVMIEAAYGVRTRWAYRLRLHGSRPLTSVLLVAPDVHDLLRQVSRRPSGTYDAAQARARSVILIPLGVLAAGVEVAG